MIRQDVPRMKEQFAQATASEDDSNFQAIMRAYGTEVVSMVGSEVRSWRWEQVEQVSAAQYYQGTTVKVQPMICTTLCAYTSLRSM